MRRCCPVKGIIANAGAEFHLLARRIILLAFEGFNYEEIAAKVDLGRHQVGVWRLRWQQTWERLTVIECCEAPLPSPLEMPAWDSRSAVVRKSEQHELLKLFTSYSYLDSSKIKNGRFNGRRRHVETLG